MSSKIKHLSAAVEIFDQEIEGVIRKIPLHSIRPSKGQPRQSKDINIEYLANSLDKDGLLQPILVTKNQGYYIIIAGERRYRAALSLRWSEIECRILNKNEQETYKLAIVENLQRENLEPLEESLAYKKLKQQFNYSVLDISKIAGKSRNYISEILSIADIPHSFLQKASKEGINSKNLLIQLAQAVKKSFGDDFIQKFKVGEISTVKAAKQYLHEASHQNKQSEQGEENSNTANLTSKVHVVPHESIVSVQHVEDNADLSEASQTTQKNEIFIKIKKNFQRNTLHIVVHTPTLHLDNIPVDQLEKMEKTIQAKIEAIINNHLGDQM